MVIVNVNVNVKATIEIQEIAGTVTTWRRITYRVLTASGDAGFMGIK